MCNNEIKICALIASIIHALCVIEITCLYTPVPVYFVKLVYFKQSVYLHHHLHLISSLPVGEMTPKVVIQIELLASG